MIAELLRSSAVNTTYSPLQWGRDQLIAELFARRRQPGLRLLLQWGRDQLIAELAAGPSPAFWHS